MYLCVKISYCNDMTESKLQLCHVFLSQVSRPLLRASSSPSTERRSWTTQEIWAEGTSATASSWHGCVSLSSWSAPYFMSTCARSSERKKQDGWKKKQTPHSFHFSGRQMVHVCFLCESRSTRQCCIVRRMLRHRGGISLLLSLKNRLREIKVTEAQSCCKIQRLTWKESDIDILGDKCSTCSA